MAKQERSRRTYEQFLDAAAEEFAQYGYSDANLQRVVDRTSLTKGALYGHFARKEDLAEALSGRLAAFLDELGERCTGRDLAELRSLTLEFAREVEADPRVNAGLRLMLDAAQTEPGAPGRLRWPPRSASRASPDAAASGEAHPRPAGEPADLALVILVGAYVTASATDRKGLAERVAALWGAVSAASGDEGQAGP
ncbi:TetR/AcrR family transcriptional regulator [Streptomyces sp. NBC_01166]|uniref:TetR family transcriptional regulator n=1 Tax=Streptomyces sp. NBC_01166 TaxID=2903755 RepID=UPI00386CBF9D|nr:TetR/AcrR family transcriptional regulator [Streptomyces sp. NBC_01166]